MPLTRPARLTALALLAACCAAFAPAPVHREDPRAEERKLQGTWEGVSYSLNGPYVDMAPGCKAVFARGRLSIIGKEGKELVRWSFTLDPTASPKRLDLRGANGERSRCIYRLEGDELQLAARVGVGGTRPGDFGGERDILVRIYRRAKPGK